MNELDALRVCAFQPRCRRESRRADRARAVWDPVPQSPRPARRSQGVVVTASGTAANPHGPGLRRRADFSRRGRCRRHRGRASVGPWTGGLKVLVTWAGGLKFLVAEIHQVVALGGSSVRASGVFRVAVIVVFGVGAGCMWERKALLECPSPDGRWQVTVLREFAGGAAGACQLALELRRAEAGWFERRLVGRWEQGCAYLDEGVRLEWRDDQRVDVGLPDRLAEDLGRGGIRQEDSWGVDVPLGDAVSEVEVRFFFWPARPFDLSAPIGFGDPGPNGFADPAAAGCFRP